jgi:hypothetical protein
MENIVIGNQCILHEEIQDCITELFQEKCGNRSLDERLAQSHA